MDYNKIQPTSWDHSAQLLMGQNCSSRQAPLLMDYEESSFGPALIEDEQK